ncbi:MAG: ArsR/SmtB family transcription factor [Motilibacteraceae bacterium]
MAPRRLEHPEPGQIRLTEVLFALSDPARLAIVRQVAESPMPAAACGEIEPDMAKSTRSHHLKTLREAGVIRNEPHGRERLLTLRRDELDALFPGLLDAVLAAPATG